MAAHFALLLVGVMSAWTSATFADEELRSFRVRVPEGVPLEKVQVFDSLGWDRENGKSPQYERCEAIAPGRFEVHDFEPRAQGRILAVLAPGCATVFVDGVPSDGILLRKSPPLVGRILNADGESLPKAKIEITAVRGGYAGVEPRQLDGLPEYESSKLADDEGRFSMPGLHVNGVNTDVHLRVTGTLDGREYTAVHTLVSTVAKDAVPGEPEALTVYPVASLSGTIVDTAGRPMAGVTVALGWRSNPEFDGRTVERVVTDDDGAFRFPRTATQEPRSFAVQHPKFPEKSTSEGHDSGLWTWIKEDDRPTLENCDVEGLMVTLDQATMLHFRVLDDHTRLGVPIPTRVYTVQRGRVDDRWSKTTRGSNGPAETKAGGGVAVRGLSGVDVEVTVRPPSGRFGSMMYGKSIEATLDLHPSREVLLKRRPGFFYRLQMPEIASHRQVPWEDLCVGIRPKGTEKWRAFVVHEAGVMPIGFIPLDKWDTEIELRVVLPHPDTRTVEHGHLLAAETVRVTPAVWPHVIEVTDPRKGRKIGKYVGRAP